jgi:hypothetical protein
MMGSWRPPARRPALLDFEAWLHHRLAALECDADEQLLRRFALFRPGNNHMRPAPCRH